MPLKREYYSDSIDSFLKTTPDEILGILARNSGFGCVQEQSNAWLEQISILQKALLNTQGTIFFEYSIPRMGKRIDVLLLVGPAIIVLEFKIGEKVFSAQAIDQVFDYALDLKNFHEPSHDALIAPILIATQVKRSTPILAGTPQNDNLLFPICCNTENLERTISEVVCFADGPTIIASEWQAGRYKPTPTIIEAALALYNSHSVEDLTRTDAGAMNLSDTANSIAGIIDASIKESKKSICFVTGVPGAGKTLVGLNIATKHIDKTTDLYSVFLSGNGPLVAILREALARDKVRREREKGQDITKGKAMSEVKAFVQNIHHFRNECLTDLGPPIEHVALFDEAQRAWNLHKTADFMQRRKKIPGFDKSEPEFLISCLDRHHDWAVVVCLVGGGQEINTGEAGISEWIESINRSFPNWYVYISPRLTDSEYGAGRVLDQLKCRDNVCYNSSLHLSVSMRSFRAENVSILVKQFLDLETNNARESLKQLSKTYPIVITRDLHLAKKWLKNKARGSERYGIVVSSQAERLKPHAIDVKSPMDPINWFLADKEDVRSSFYLEDVATEFTVQGLELDWVCVTWDADFRFSENGWEHWSFKGHKWNHIRKLERQSYLKNAYRVLLTRARQGMVIVVPQGDPEDPTRRSEFYDGTFDYLQRIGFTVI